MGEQVGDYVRLNHGALISYVTEIFERVGVSHDDAYTTADVLVAADLRGVESHGMQRLWGYVSRLQKGGIEAKPKVQIVHETPTTAVVDGGNGLGQPVSKYAMELCLRKAEELGGAFVAVRNSTHFGISGYYAMMALPRNMIGISMTNGHPLTVPTYGRQRMFGTNPLSMAVPTDKERPFVLDMATSAVAAGKLEVADRKGMPIPHGWAVDKTGQSTTNASALREGGAMLPLGGLAESAGYKGYGLAVMVDILCGVLSGAGFGLYVGSPAGDKPANIGHFFAAIRPDGFRSLSDFTASMDTMIRDLKSSEKAEGEERIYIAGEKEYIKEDDARKNGIPILRKVADEIRRIGGELGVEWKMG
jgi:LDH2 family malate/lactate/ureidoglycolate dehydrogenase